jgi:hypothetical protein
VVSLGDLLVQDLTQAMLVPGDGVPRSVALWFDPDEQWRRVADAVAPVLGSESMHLLVLGVTDSQVALKLRLLSRSPSERLIVYLPSWSGRDLRAHRDAHPRLWSLAEYGYVGAVWAASPGGDAAPPIVEWLERHGIRLGGGAPARKRLTSGGADARLSRWLARVLETDVRDVPEPLREADVADVLGGNPTSSVIDLLLDPERALRLWADDAGDTIDRIRERFGLAVDAGAEPEALADAVATDLALTEAWDALGRSGEFPFMARLPVSESARTDVLKFVRKDLLARGDASQAFLRRVAQQEVSLVPLAEWSSDLPGTPACLPRLAAARWLLAIDRVKGDAIGGWRGSVKSLEVEAQPGHPALPVDLPSIPGVTPTSWSGLTRLRDIVRRAEVAIAGAATSDVADLVRAYVGDWWHIDDDYLGFRRDADRYPPLAPLRAIADEAYVTYLEASAHRWTDHIESGGDWDGGIRSVQDLAADLWGPTKGARATLIVDAVRWDIAMQVQERIGSIAQVHPVLSTLPSTTPFGMTALLPLDGPPDAVAKKGVALMHGGHEVSAREGRKAYLTGWFETQGRTVAFLELDDIIQGSPIPKVDHLVVFNYTLDQTGHAPATAATLPTEAESHVARLALAVQQLHRAKFRRVDLVTDHGFLYMSPERIDGLGRPSVPAPNVWNRDPRYVLLKPDALAPDLVRVQAPMVPGTYVGVPRGVRTLEKASLYAHGGVSLQECVIPHLVSESADTPRTLKVEVTPSSTRMAGGTVAVTVRPIMEQEQLTLTAPPRLRLRMWLEVVKPDGARSPVSDALDLDVRGDSPEIRQALFLRDDVSIQAGSGVYLRARDLDTMADLSESALTLSVDWG